MSVVFQFPCVHWPFSSYLFAMFVSQVMRISASLLFKQIFFFDLTFVLRFIYNRVLLENPAVTAAAVSTLAKFGATCEDLLPNIITLLKRCLMDSDDEVSHLFYQFIKSIL